ncbi:RelE family toxin-antitoxin system [Klebsiella pneumoniae]|nr:RelE family toxin-antitoxin system [Klebsiella pneumoniae]SLQ94462.1 RelE family toxin-antitoxin system [Klebsiella pneumoniae]SLQ95055.1 RelE family toxin-antitoxin system [Klebsiella pneumoniae]SLR01922.1 RelE family toxin-antitoxin system [Klebsiella pneumoniae]SLR13509.1 RelE family toxin-antitoxin system [Klebsiella pneumoniae]
MTANITALAQREKFEAWFVNDVVGTDVNFPAFKDGEYTEGEIYDEQLYFMLQAMWMAWKAAGAELVEALEKAQKQTTESENRVRKQNRHICELFDYNTALRQRIAGLEARTVKLPDLRQIVSGDRYVWSDGVYNYSQDVKVALAAAGIKVEVE